MIREAAMLREMIQHKSTYHRATHQCRTYYNAACYWCLRTTHSFCASLAWQAGSRNCFPPAELMLRKPILPDVLFSGEMFISFQKSSSPEKRSYLSRCPLLRKPIFPDVLCSSAPKACAHRRLHDVVFREAALLNPSPMPITEQMLIGWCKVVHHICVHVDEFRNPRTSRL